MNVILNLGQAKTQLKDLREYLLTEIVKQGSKDLCTYLSNMAADEMDATKLVIGKDISSSYILHESTDGISPNECPLEDICTDHLFGLLID